MRPFTDDIRSEVHRSAAAPLRPFFCSGKELLADAAPAVFILHDESLEHRMQIGGQMLFRNESDPANDARPRNDCDEYGAMRRQRLQIIFDVFYGNVVAELVRQR